MTLDGYTDHTVGIADDQLHDFFTAQMDNVDIELFGRVTYQLMESYWPSAPQDPAATKSMIAFAGKINAMRKIVFSSTLKKVEWNNTTLIRDNMIEEVMKLKKQPGRNISVGGVSIIQEFMRHGLFDECWVLVHPVLASKGKKLFDGFENIVKLNLLETETFQSGVVVLHYAFITPVPHN